MKTKLLLILTAFGLLIINASATITVVSKASSSGNATAVTTKATTITGVTSGDQIIVLTDWAGTPTVSSVADGGDTFTSAVSKAGTGSFHLGANILSTTTTKSGSVTVTVTYSASVTYPEVSLLDVQGAGGGGDGTNSAVGSSGTSSSGSVTTTNANDLLVGVTEVANLVSGGGTGWTNTITANSNAYEYQIVSATGAYTATWTGSNNEWTAAMATFKSTATATLLPTNAIYTFSPGLSFRGGIPNRCATTALANTSTVSQIQTALNAATSGTAVLLSPGTYAIGTGNPALTIPANVSLRGAGTNTILQYSGTGTAIQMGGGATWGSRVTVSSGSTQNSTSIVVASATGISVGDLIVISQLNPSYVNLGSNITWSGAPGSTGGSTNDTARNMEQVDKVTAISGTTLTLERPLYIAYSNTPVINVIHTPTVSPGLENLEIESTGAGDDIQSINIDGADRPFLIGVTNKLDSGTANYAHMFFRDVYAGEVRQCVLIGGGVNSSGQDYGTYLTNNVSECLIEDNIYIGMRHSMIVAGGPSGNVFGYNYSKGNYQSDSPSGYLEDTQGHGTTAYMNLWEGNITPELWNDAVHGGDAFNTFFRNWSVTDTSQFAVTQHIIGIELDNLSYQDNVLANEIASSKWTGNGSYTALSDSGTTTNHLSNYDQAATAYTDTQFTGTLPNSLYYTAKPTWFASGDAWPSVVPGTANPTNPALERYNGQGLGTSQPAPTPAPGVVSPPAAAPGTIPNVVGEKQSDAQANIAAVQINAALTTTTTTESSSTVASGNVISQNPVAGSPAVYQSNVALVVSSGPASNSFNIGTTSILSTTDSGNGNAIFGIQVTLSQSAKLNTLSFYTINSAGTYVLGLYDNTGAGGSPGALKAQTAEITPVPNGWTTAPTTTNPVLAAGTYFVMCEASSGSLSFPGDSTTGTFYSNTLTYNKVMPNPFPQTGKSTGTFNYSMYATLTPSTTTTSAAWGGTAPTLPFNLVASNYDTGGSGTAYNHATSGGTNGTTYRTDGGGELKANTDTGSPINWVLGFGSAGSWDQYTVTVPTGGATYTFSARCGSQTGGSFHISVDGTAGSTVQVPAQGTWDMANEWQTIAVPGNVAMTAGSHVIRITVDSSWVDFASLNVTVAGATFAVPNVIGLTEAQADTAIAAVDSLVVADSSSTDPKVPSGSVISQSPVAGTKVSSGATVSIVISTGPATGRPATYPGNTEVSVSPGTGTLSTAMNAHGANTTYLLSAGTYNEGQSGNSPLFQVQSNCQVIGQNADKNTDSTIIKVTSWAGGWGVFDDSNSGNSSNFELWGCTLDMNQSTSGYARGTQLNNGSGGVLIQNCHFININSSQANQERFIILNGVGTTVDNCRFGFAGQASDVSTGGYTVIADGTVSNCVFDTISSVVAYYHCIGDPCAVTNSTWTAPSGNTNQAAFIYGEPGNGVPSGTPKSTASGNTVNLNNNTGASFNDLGCHGVMSQNWWGGIDINGNNTISNGVINEIDFYDGSLAGPKPEVVETTIQHNTLSNTTMDNSSTWAANNFSIGSYVTSPNP